jgi:DTW domain-containing protein YfiP
LRDGYCICADVPRVPSRTQVVVVRHDRESFKSTGTARVALQALANGCLVEYGDDSGPANEALLPYVKGAALLFPQTGVEPAPLEGPPARLIVLDGTWRQTRRMLRRLTVLEHLPRLVLPAKLAAPLRLRETNAPEGRSTLEAIADALGLLEGEALSTPLHALHALYVERVFRARGVWTQKSRVLA